MSARVLVALAVVVGAALSGCVQVPGSALDRSSVLPGGAHTVVLVSSRRPLSGLDGAERIRLGVLPPAAARQG